MVKIHNNQAKANYDEFESLQPTSKKNELTKSVNELQPHTKIQQKSKVKSINKRHVKIQPTKIETEEKEVIEYKFPRSSAEISKLPENQREKAMADRREICSQIKRGDILVMRVTGKKNVHIVDLFITYFQALSQKLGFASKKSDSSAIHVAVVVGVDSAKGNVIISEAMPGKHSGLRTVDLFEHSSCKLPKGSGYDYQIFHAKPHFAKVAKKAAAIAERFAPKASYLLTPEEKAGKIKEKDKKYLVNKFSFLTALKGMFKTKEFDFDAQKRLFKGIFEEYAHTNVSIGGKKYGRKMFCSAFAAQVFQKAAAEDAWNALVKKHPDLISKLQKVEKKTHDMPNRNANKDISNWAKEMARSHGDELGQKMKAFDIDFKKTTPQDLVRYFTKHGVAEHAFNIVPRK